MDEQKGRIIPRNIEDEMQHSYIDYSMSVIVGRALPNVWDGLKPVQRRILFAMYQMGNVHSKPYRKSARIVGDVIGKYHPHGDQAVYDALVRMAQPFTMRLPLVDGQGNFGSLDGDMPAAMRYTEVRLTKASQELVRDIEKQTVGFNPNYDGSFTEPVVLPTVFPNLLVNGASGIAVGMATNIPPHNLGELCEAIVYLVDHPDATVDELMRFVKGPDFPTGGIIVGRQGIRDAYTTGRGKIRVRASAFIDEEKGRNRIIITEIPYQVNKANLVRDIASLVSEKKLEGISEIRDESDREGLRVVIELKRTAPARVVLNNLFKKTDMTTTFGVIVLAIENNRPILFNLKTYLESFIEFRRNVIIRRTIFELKKAKERLHILEGLKIALDNLDLVISVIRKAASPQEAKAKLEEKLSLSDAQAQAILDMKLARLTALEQDKVMDEYNSIKALIKELKGILDSPERVREIIKSETERIKGKYATPRRTQIIEAEGEIADEDLIARENMVVSLTAAGYVKRTPLSVYRTQHRGGRGKVGMSTKEEDYVKDLFVGSTHDIALFFTTKGRVFSLKTYEVPESGTYAKGTPIVNLLDLTPGEKVTTMLSIKEFDEQTSIVFATANGVVKMTPTKEYSNVRRHGIIAANIDEDDSLVSVALTRKTGNIFIATREGKGILFPISELRDIGRATRGVKGINLRPGDSVVGMVIAKENTALCFVTSNGFGKRTKVSDFPVQHRAGYGVIAIRITEKTGELVGIIALDGKNRQIALTTNQGMIIRIPASEISVIGRATQGVKLISLAPEQLVACVGEVKEEE